MYTEAGYFGFIRSGLRSKWVRWPPRYHVLNAAKRPSQKPKLKWEYQCSCCKEWFAQSEVEVDHLLPCGSLNSLEDLPIFVGRLFCEPDGLRVVCKPCHLKITQESRDGKVSEPEPSGVGGD